MTPELQIRAIDRSVRRRLQHVWNKAADDAAAGPRFAVVYHLLSITHNWRLRVRVFAADDEFPVVDSVIGIWPSANWYEREAFDLFGIMFTGHPDLRRILTDYGFVGHPFRKDFPLSGNVEMRYDPDQQRVIYQPVTIEPREITPRIVREENYADTRRVPQGLNMAEIRNYTMNFGSDVTCRAQVSLRCNKPLKRRAVARCTIC